MLSLLAANMTIVWVVLLVLFLVIEAATAGLATIWFAVGSLAALISALFNAPIWLQIIWFLVISGVTLWFTRPLVLKYVNRKSQPTNADMAIGAKGIITETVDNIAGTGAVSLQGKVWTARSESGEIIPAGVTVIGKRIDGVKLYVALSEAEGAHLSPGIDEHPQDKVE